MIRIATAIALAVCLTACAKEESQESKQDSAKVEQAAKVTASQAANRTNAEKLTLDTLLKKHFAALGGEKKLRTAQTLMYGGKKYYDGKSVEITKYIKRGNKLRVEKRHGDEVSIMAFNGKKAWKKKGDKVKALPEKELSHLEYESSIDDALLVYRDKGYKVRLIGKAEVKGSPAYHVELIVPERMTENRFIDAASYFEVKRVVAWKDKENKMKKVTVYFSEYRDIGDGMMINHRVDWKNEKGKGKFIIEKAAYNQPMNDSLFELGGRIM
ncbi:MAG: hypothetical protein MJE77_09140 [Proteobacteria bacterium]|nr:hypothetical protein [Pseudomonadota bacterium]